MPFWKRIGFAFVFIVPALMPLAAWLGARFQQPALMAWFPLFFLFVLLPLADHAVGHDASNPDAGLAGQLERDRWFRLLTLLAVPVQFATLGWSMQHASSAGFSLPGMLGWVLSQGVVGGVLAINVAHELIHKDTTLERGAGGMLLTSVGYHGFKVEHLRGHHVHVSTPLDASSARRGQSLWHFLPRALLRNTSNAWRLEAARLRRSGKHWWQGNELLAWSVAWLVLALASWAWLGGAGLLFFVAQGVVAACSLEIINYIEHYGLERRQLPDAPSRPTPHTPSRNAETPPPNPRRTDIPRWGRWCCLLGAFPPPLVPGVGSPPACLARGFRGDRLSSAPGAALALADSGTPGLLAAGRPLALSWLSANRGSA